MFFGPGGLFCLQNSCCAEVEVALVVGPSLVEKGSYYLLAPRV